MFLNVRKARDVLMLTCTRDQQAPTSADLDIDSDEDDLDASYSQRFSSNAVNCGNADGTPSPAAKSTHDLARDGRVEKLKTHLDRNPSSATVTDKIGVAPSYGSIVFY